MKINFINSIKNSFDQPTEQLTEMNINKGRLGEKNQDPSYFQFYKQSVFPFKGISTSTNIIPKEDLGGFTLPNNLKVIVDTNSKNNETDLRLKLTANKKLNIQSSVSELVSEMLEQNSDKVTSALEKDNVSPRIFNHSHFGNIDGYIVGDSIRTKEGLSVMLNQIFNPSFTETCLKSAKDSLKLHYLDVSQDKIYQLEDELRHGSLEERKNSIDAVTIADIQNYYKDFLENSEGTIVISMPKIAYNSQKNDILNILSDSIPRLSPNKNSQSKSYSDMFSKNITIENIQNKKMQYDKYYAVNDGITIKDSVVNSMLAEAIKLTLQKNLNSNLDVTSSVDYYPIKNNGYLNISIRKNKNVFNLIEKKSSDMRKYEDVVNILTNQLMTIPISSSELDEIKQNEKKDILKIIYEQSNKTDVLINQSQGNYNYLNDYSNAIDAITAIDIQLSAQKIFSKPAITVISKNQV